MRKACVRQKDGEPAVQGVPPDIPRCPTFVHEAEGVPGTLPNATMPGTRSTFKAGRRA